MYSRNRDGEKALSPLPSRIRGEQALFPCPPCVREGAERMRGGRVVKVGVMHTKQPFRLAFGKPPPLTQGRLY